MRLSIDKASERTKRELQLKHDRLPVVSLKDIGNLIRKGQIDDLLHGAHIVTKIEDFEGKPGPERLLTIIFNNAVDALAAEFPDLVIVKD